MNTPVPYYTNILFVRSLSGATDIVSHSIIVFSLCLFLVDRWQLQLQLDSYRLVSLTTL